MGSVQVSAAGRSDQAGARVVVYQPERSLNPNAAPSPDLNPYGGPEDRCVALTTKGVRCRGKKVLGSNLCMVHYRRTDESE